MEDRLKIKVEKSEHKFSHIDAFTLIGSCFSDELNSHFQMNGFDVISNPFGTIFHPVAICSQLDLAINDSEEIAVYQRGDLYFDWLSAGTIYGTTESELKEKILKQRKLLREQLQKQGVLVLTLGTAFGYVREDVIVGNCHKAPRDKFKKELTSVDRIVTELKNIIGAIKAINEEVKIVITVSPVRHKKDGLIENNRSKARLIEASHIICDEKLAHYFPSYELVLDDLRDYRYFKEDLVHPTKTAVDYVWDVFKNTFISKGSIELGDLTRKINLELNHISIYPNSAAEQKRTTDLEQKVIAFAKKHPEINWY